MKKIVSCVILITLLGCKSVLVIESDDPKHKIRDGVRMLESGRTLPAQRLFEEAYQIAKEKNDDSLTAMALAGLGDVHRYRDEGSQAQTTYSLSKAAQKFEDAAEILRRLNYNRRLSLIYHGLSVVYREEQNLDKTCEYINKAAKAYYNPPGGPEDVMPVSVEQKLLPFFEQVKAANFKISCGSSNKPKK